MTTAVSKDVQCYRFDFTVGADGVSVDDMHGYLRPLCKNYVFQMERGEERSDKHPDGYLHYQGRLSLMKKMQVVPAAKMLSSCGHNFHLSPSSNNSLNGEAFYCMKVQTRVLGPWSEKDFKERPPLTRRLQKVMEHGLLPWQAQLKDLVDCYDDRHILLVHDQTGNSGKSSFVEYMEYEGLAFQIPAMRLMEEIMGCAMSVPAQKCYLIDMPRGMKKDKLGDFYAGLESLKDGVMYDKRYHFKKRRIECPQIVVFTNTEPDWDLMSKDRWQLHTIESLTEDHIEYISDPYDPDQDRDACIEEAPCSQVDEVDEEAHLWGSPDNGGIEDEQAVQEDC